MLSFHKLNLAVATILLSSLWAGAQASPANSDREVEVWGGGGPSVPGGAKDTGVFNLGLRYGWVLTPAFGPGPLKGRFEYAVDAIPLFLIFQPANTADGVGFNPINLKWNFVSYGRLSPYLEVGGGVLFTNHSVPAGTNNLNFMPSVALGTHILRERHNLSIEVRYLHISNASLTTPNPGLNTVQIRLGLGKFFHH